MNTIGVFVMGAAAGAVLGVSAKFRTRDVLAISAGAFSGAVLVALALGSIAISAEWLAGQIRAQGIGLGTLIGTLFGGAASYLLGVLGISFFGFLFGPDRGVVATLRASGGRGAVIVAVIGAFFGGLSGAVMGALKDTGLL